MKIIDRLTGKTQKRRSLAAEAALWAGQGLLGSMFLKACTTKLAKPIPELEEKFGFPKVVGGPMTRFIGAAEVAGGLGALLPAGTRIAPWLTPIAAGALGAVMLLASGYHLGRKELAYLKMPIALGALAGLVAIGRGKLKPVPARC
ncbi:MAG TPA: DoxX family protein [Kofleriaceae bacterium]|nr:DoxX family protein [Kofleriaceae bacterium]